MNKNRLQITSIESKSNNQSVIVSKGSRRQEIQATMERLWHQNPRQFDPQRDCMQRQRVQKTIEALKKSVGLESKNVVDLGCGAGDISRLIRDAGSKVDAVDVASIALQHLEAQDTHGISPIQDCLPMTKLKDDSYDVVVCTEVIGFLKSSEYRLLFAELSRLVKMDGQVVCSSELDINTEDPLVVFASLAETEFNIEEWIFSHHLLFIRLCRFFETPAHYIKASHNPELRLKEAEKKSTLGRWWFTLNTTRVIAIIWRLINLGAAPLAATLRQNRWTMNFLENICRFLWSESGISHALFIGKRRPLTFPLPADEIPRELKHKKQLWE